MLKRSKNALLTELKELTDELHANKHEVPNCDVGECLQKLEAVKKKRAKKKPFTRK
jgi:hypothetical protein